MQNQRSYNEATEQKNIRSGSSHLKARRGKMYKTFKEMVLFTLTIALLIFPALRIKNSGPGYRIK